MDAAEKIIRYLVDKYSPSVLISYGSFADGSANAGSDYDALLVYDGRECHDGSVIDGTPLDVFCYPAESFSGDYDPEKYLGVFDGKIINRPSGNGDARKLLDMIVIGEYLDGGQLHGVTPSPVPTATTEEAGN